MILIRLIVAVWRRHRGRCEGPWPPNLPVWDEQDEAVHW